MEVATTREVAGASEADAGEAGGPLENPAVRQEPGDPLLEPHPDEPGVKGDGGAAAPLENPGRARS
jgi:hypothetical protein